MTGTTPRFPIILLALAFALALSASLTHHYAARASGPDVYRDGKLGWHDWSWSTSMIQSGGALQISYDRSWAAASFGGTALGMSGYNALRVEIEPSGGLPALEVAVYDGDGEQLSGVMLKEHAYDSGGGRYRADIPLSALGASGRTVTRIHIKEYGRGDVPAPFRIHAVRFLEGSSSGVSSGASSSTAAPTPTATSAASSSSSNTQYVVFTSDDNHSIAGNRWLVNLFDGKRNADGSRARMTFFINGWYEDEDDIVDSLAAVHKAGHEIANHGYSHTGPHDEKGWRSEIERVNAFTRDDVGAPHPSGFRAPFFSHNNALTDVLEDMEFSYNSSRTAIASWPYRLSGDLWELPPSAFLIPGHLQDRYGSEIHGCDWSLFDRAEVSPGHYYAILKHNLDRRLSGDRPPLVLCIHSHYYDGRSGSLRDALSRFLVYALDQGSVRVTTAAAVVKAFGG